MATNIRTTQERIRILYTAAATLRNAAKQCQETQKYHDNCSDYANRAENVNARMAAIQDMIQSVSNELAELATDANMAFQFEWRAGKFGVEEITVVSSAQTIHLNMTNTVGNNYVQSAFVNALSVGDVVRLKDSPVNSMLYIVSTMPQAAGVQLYGIGQPLNNESLLFRVVKELKGE